MVWLLTPDEELELTRMFESLPNFQTGVSPAQIRRLLNLLQIDPSLVDQSETETTYDLSAWLHLHHLRRRKLWASEKFTHTQAEKLWTQQLKKNLPQNQVRSQDQTWFRSQLVAYPNPMSGEQMIQLWERLLPLINSSD